MPRSADHQHRDRLLDDVARDLVANGLTGASLDRLAAAAGTSARMLIHHFRSRRRLLEAALERARQWQVQRARTALPATPEFVDDLAAAWPWFSSDETRRYFRLFSQVAAAGRLDEQAGVRAALAVEWLSLLGDGFIAAGCRPGAAHRLATVVAAQLRGLFLDLDATDDVRRVQRSYQDFVALVAASPHLAGRAP